MGGAAAQTTAADPCSRNAGSGESAKPRECNTVAEQPDRTLTRSHNSIVGQFDWQTGKRTKSEGIFRGMGTRPFILLIAALLAAAIVLVFRDELHARADAVRILGQHGCWDVLPMTDKHRKRPRDPTSRPVSVISPSSSPRRISTSAE